MKKTNVKSNKKPRKKVGEKTIRSKPNDVSPRVDAKKKPKEETMDRPTLIGIARLLKSAGSDVKALKSDDDAQLQRKVNDAVQRLPSPEVLKQLENIDPVKLVNVLKDCFGVFVDFSDVSCVRCPDAKACVAAFVGNLKDGMKRFHGAMIDGDGGKAKLAVETEPELRAVTRYEADRLVFVKDVPNPNPEEDDYHDTIQRVLDEQPETLAELRAIVERDFDVDGDGDFMKFVTALRDPKEGVVKLDVDLSEKDKTALRGAGYDV